MKITDEASKMIRDALESNHCTGIQLSLQESCCGTSLAFHLIQLEGNSYTTVNGVPVVMDAAVEGWMEHVTIELKNGNLALRRRRVLLRETMVRVNIAIQQNILFGGIRYEWKGSIWTSLFGGSKKGGSGCCNMEIVEEPESGCCCGSASEPYEADGTDATGALSSVKVLGPGCKNCHTLLGNVQLALKEIGSPLAVEYVTDMATVASYGIMSTPALVVNEKVAASGKVMKSGDVVKLLHKLGY